MLPINDYIFNNWFEKKSGKKYLKELRDFKVRKGIPETYSELCQTFDAWMEHITKLALGDTYGPCNTRPKLDVDHLF